MGILHQVFSKLTSTELLLLWANIFFLLAILTFLLLIFINRKKTAKKSRLEKLYSGDIENRLFSIIFDNQNYQSLVREPLFRKRWKKRVYREFFLKRLIDLHRVYEGEGATRLQQFYRSSGLMRLSYFRIRSGNWHLQCEGIQELGELEVRKAATTILKYTRSENETLKMIAIIEVLHLKGLQGLLLLKDHNEPLNDWIQLNILESVKEAHPDEAPDFQFLLEASNESLVILGLRLISLFRQSQHLPNIIQLQKSPSEKVRQESEIALMKMNLSTSS